MSAPPIPLTLNANRSPPKVCERRDVGEGWRTCHYCVSLWHPELFGEDWKPTTCVEHRA